VVGNRVSFADLNALDFAKGAGLLPAVIRHAENGSVLMLGFMNREALVATLARRRVVFFSRSKGRLWEKGETSGHTLELADVHMDCDRDALLISAWPSGPVCHSGSASCFGESMEAPSADPATFLATLEAVIEERSETRPDGSYTAKLLASGWLRIAQKVGEEGLEAALAGAGGRDEEVVAEVADLLYHVLVMLKARGLAFERVMEELRKRHSAPRQPSSNSG
jgi:phosphoribosyl-ATP pyrophosphohydrolase/phosphoribosyl-AMP cyclohydrolase